MGQSTERKIGRRALLKGTAAAAGWLVLEPDSALGTSANSTLEIGIIGCGGRGTWIAGLFEEHTNTKVVALHDYFRDRVDAAGDRFGVGSAQRFIGLDGYRQLLNARLDAVAIESPPYFHPEQTVAALEAGKHVFLAKPVAVDVPGCKAVVKAAEKAQGTLSTLVDFQTRADPLFCEAARRVHAGEIGKPVCGQALYHTGRLNPRGKGEGAVARLRNWVFDKALSGDIIVEQNVHVLDVANWLLQARPVAAWGSGGRKVRTDVGDAWDHFVVTFVYPGDVLIGFSSSQFLYGFHDMCTRVYCERCTVDSHYGGEVSVQGKEMTWKGGVTNQIYREGAVANIKAFHQSILEGKPLNNARESADSTMTCILGRTAAYTGRKVTWDDIRRANKPLRAHLELPANGPYL